MKYAIIDQDGGCIDKGYIILDQDGDCVAKGYIDLNSAIRKAKYFLLREVHFNADTYQLHVHEIQSVHIIGDRVATVSLELDWTVEKAK